MNRVIIEVFIVLMPSNWCPKSRKPVAAYPQKTKKKSCLEQQVVRNMTNNIKIQRQASAVQA